MRFKSKKQVRKFTDRKAGSALFLRKAGSINNRQRYYDDTAEQLSEWQEQQEKQEKDNQNMVVNAVYALELSGVLP